jgi:hypothetical protein
MDLSNIIPTSDEIVVTLKYPGTDKVLDNDDGTPMTITLYAPHTKEYKAGIYEQANKRIKDQQKEFTIQDWEESTTELLLKAIKDWDITFGGKKPKLTPAKAKEVFNSKAGFWIAEQVQEKVNSFEAFTPA